MPTIVNLRLDKKHDVEAQHIAFFPEAHNQVAQSIEVTALGSLTQSLFNCFIQTLNLRRICRNRQLDHHFLDRRIRSTSRHAKFLRVSSRG